MAVLKTALSRPTKRRLQRETVDKGELLPHDDARSGLSRLLHHKIAWVKSKILIILAKQQRKNSFFQSISLLIWTSIHKQVFGSWVSVIITIEKDISWVLRLSHHYFGRVELRTNFLAWRDPLSIQVQAREWAPIVAYDYTVGVKHRNYFENEVVSQITGTFIIAHQVLQSALHHKRGIRFTWVNSGRQDNSSSLGNQFWPRVEISYDYHFAVVTGNGFREDGFADLVLRLVST